MTFSRYFYWASPTKWEEPVFSSHLQAASLAIPERRCLDLAYRWLSLCRPEACDYAVEKLSSLSDEELADQCIARWGLDQVQGDDNDLTWFEQHEADRLMLARAFGVARDWLQPSRKPTI